MAPPQPSPVGEGADSLCGLGKWVGSLEGEPIIGSQFERQGCGRVKRMGWMKEGDGESFIFVGKEIDGSTQ